MKRLISDYLDDHKNDHPILLLDYLKANDVSKKLEEERHNEIRVRGGQLKEYVPNKGRYDVVNYYLTVMYIENSIAGRAWEDFLDQEEYKQYEKEI